MSQAALLHDESGFTLLELLVVILIIGLLAAIALPSLLGQRQKATDAAAKSAVRNAVSQIEVCLTQVAPNPPDSCATDAQVTGALDAAAPGGAVTVSGFGSYVLMAMSHTGNSFTIAKDSGATTRSCTSAGAGNGGCRGTQW